MAQSSGSSPRLVPGLMRAVDILELLAESDPMSATEVSQALKLPRTTTHELLSTLVARGFVEADNNGVRRFRLGPTLLWLGSHYRADIDLSRDAHVVAEMVAQQCGETVHVGRLIGREVLYIAKVESTHPVRMVSEFGVRLPAHLTAVGKAMLAHLPRSEFDALYPAGTVLEAFTPNSITSLSELRRELATVRERGTATEFEESNPDVGCIAAPVFDHRGKIAAGLSISVPSYRHTEELHTKWSELARWGATELSHRLGHGSDD